MDGVLKVKEMRAGVWSEAQAMIDAAEAEDRGFTAEEEKQYNDLMSKLEHFDKRIARLEESERRTAQMAASDGAGAARRSPGSDPSIGMSQQDVRNYSLVRAIRAAVNGDWRGAELEREASEAVAQRFGRDPQGFFVPYDWQTRDLVVGTPTAGGNLVATDMLAQSFIEMLRNKMVVRQAGSTMLTGLVGDVAIPRQTGGATAYWVGESGGPTESQQTVDQVALTPHCVGAYTDMSRKLLKQSSVDVEMFVRNDLAAIVALAIDYAALHGNDSTDANQPDGVANTSGIGSVAGGTDGAAPTWANIVKLETEVAQDNGDVGKLAYITNAKVRGKLKETMRVSTLWRRAWMTSILPEILAPPRTATNGLTGCCRASPR